MIPHLQQVIHSIQSVEGILAVFTSGTVASVAVSLYRRYQKFKEDQVISTFYGNEDGPWQSAHGVVGDLGLKAALSDARGFFPHKATGWRTHIDYWKVAPFRWRHAFRRRFTIPSKEEADRILKRLWERGLLRRAGWTQTRNEFYRLKD